MFYATCQYGYENPRKYFPPTFVVEESLHLHGWPGVSDTEHGAGYNALLSWRAVCGPHQAPIRLVMESLQNLHRLASAHRQLPTATISGHKVVDHDSQLTTTGQLKWDQERTDVSQNLMMVYCKVICFYSAQDQAHKHEHCVKWLQDINGYDEHKWTKST